MTRATDKAELASTPPFKARFNTDVITRMFHARDHEMFTAFTDIELEAEEGSKFSMLSASLMPQRGEVKDFDMDLSIKPDNMGVSSANIAYKGAGSFDGA